MPCCFGSPTDLILRVRNGPLLVPRARTGRVPTNEGVFSNFCADIRITRCLYTKKMDVHFHLHWWFPHQTHSVLPFASGHMCREHKKRDVSFHYEKQVSPVQGMNFPFWPLWSFFYTFDSLHSYVPLIEHSVFTLGIPALPSALSRLFWQPTLGVFSQLTPPCIQQFAYHNELGRVYRQNKCPKASGKF